MALSTRIRLEVIPLSLSLACMTQKKNWLREILRARSMQQFFPRGLFTVSIDGLSKRKTTHSLYTDASSRRQIKHQTYHKDFYSLMFCKIPKSQRSLEEVQLWMLVSVSPSHPWFYYQLYLQKHRMWHEVSPYRLDYYFHVYVTLLLRYSLFDYVMHSQVPRWTRARVSSGE